VTRDLIRQYREMFELLPEAGQAPSAALRAHRRGAANQMVFAKALPAFGEALAAQTGELLVERFHPETQMPRDERDRPFLRIEQNVWEVFDPTGRWLGNLDLPERFRPFQVGADYILGVRLGGSGEEQVAVYRLTR
jgi:hypothetical protein